jgi:hypothetical protein
MRAGVLLRNRLAIAERRALDGDGGRIEPEALRGDLFGSWLRSRLFHVRPPTPRDKQRCARGNPGEAARARRAAARSSSCDSRIPRSCEQRWRPQARV